MVEIEDITPTATATGSKKPAQMVGAGANDDGAQLTKVCGASRCMSQQPSRGCGECNIPLASCPIQAELKKLQKEAVAEAPKKPVPEAAVEASTTLIGNLIRLLLVVRHLERPQPRSSLARMPPWAC